MADVLGLHMYHAWSARTDGWMDRQIDHDRAPASGAMPMQIRSQASQPAGARLENITVQWTRSKELTPHLTIHGNTTYQHTFIL